MNGIALTVLISQLPKLFSFSTDALTAIPLLKPYKHVPGLLLAVFAATNVVGTLNRDATASAKVLDRCRKDYDHLPCHDQFWAAR